MSSLQDNQVFLYGRKSELLNSSAQRHAALYNARCLKFCSFECGFKPAKKIISEERQLNSTQYMLILKSSYV